MPSYLAMSDMGFTSVAVREIIMLRAKENTKKALAVLQTTWAMLLVLTVVSVTSLALVLWSFDVADTFNIHVLSDTDFRFIILSQVLIVFIGFQCQLAYGGFACEGKYGRGFKILGSMRLAGQSSIWLMALLGFGPVTASITAMFVWLVGLLLFERRLAGVNTWWRYGFAHFNRHVFRRLWKPALAQMSFPISNAMNIQGMRIVIGMTLGAQAVVAFTTIRTLTRMSTQLLNSINWIVSPEIGAAFGKNDIQLLRTLHRRSCQLSIWLAVFVGLGLTLCSDFIIRVWTHGNVTPNLALTIILVAVTIVNSFWYTSLMIEYATNRHMHVSKINAPANIVAVLFAYGLALTAGIEAAAIPLLLVEIIMVAVVVPRSLDQTQDNLKDFVVSLTRPPTRMLKHILQNT